MLFSCEKDEVLIEDLILQDGYIDVNISGRSNDGSLVKGEASYVFYPTHNENRFNGVSISESNYRFSFGRVNDIHMREYIRIEFETNSEMDSIYNTSIELYYREEQVDGSILFYEADTDYSILKPSITIKEFDTTTLKLKGDYSYSNGEGDNVAIVTGKFLVNLDRIHY